MLQGETMSLPYELYTLKQIREIELSAFNTVSKEVLMKRAGEAAFSVFFSVYPDAENIAVFCGGGNNGGDGFVFARCAFEKGFSVSVYYLGDKSQYSDEAKASLMQLESLDIEVIPYDGHAALKECEVVVDALLGIGVKNNVEGIYKQAISEINASECFILSLDLPSGIDANTGKALGSAVFADVTVTFIGLKQGMLTGDAVDYCGDIYCDTLDLEPELERHAITSLRLDEVDISAMLPRRLPSMHKGNFGHVLIVGGEYGYAGAVRMAAEAALRVGAGKVSVFTRLSHHNVVLSGRPELICLPFEEPFELSKRLEQFDAIVVGPGLDDSKWSEDVIQNSLIFKGKKIIDAGALAYLAKNDISLANTILTPHPGEAAKLLNTEVEAVQANRFNAVLDIAKKYQSITVLKGAGTIIQTLNDVPYVCSLGNVGMASAGMGDVLAGIMGGFCAQGTPLEDVAAVSVLLHAFSADLAVKEKGIYGLLASDLFDSFLSAIEQSRESLIDIEDELLL